LLHKVIGWSDKETIPLPESDFTRKFIVSGTDTELAVKLLNPGSRMPCCGSTISPALVVIHGNTISIEIEDDLSRPRKEAVLTKFLEEAERIVEAVVQKSAQSANSKGALSSSGANW